MDFYAVLDQIVALLRQRQRVTYRALKLQFQLDEEALEALRDELMGIGKSNGLFHRPQHGVSPHAPRQRLASPVGSWQATGPRRRARTGRVAGDGQPALLYARGDCCKLEGPLDGHQSVVLRCTSVQYFIVISSDIGYCDVFVAQ